MLRGKGPHAAVSRSASHDHSDHCCSPAGQCRFSRTSPSCCALWGPPLLLPLTGLLTIGRARLAAAPEDLARGGGDRGEKKNEKRLNPVGIGASIGGSCCWFSIGEERKKKDKAEGQSAEGAATTARRESSCRGWYCSCDGDGGLCLQVSRFLRLV